MIKFYDLVNLNIEHELLSIRRYHENDLLELEAIFKPEFFTWYTINYQTAREFVVDKMIDYEKGQLVMLVIIDKKTNKIIGTTSLYEISLGHKRLELGSTWLSDDYQGTQYNALVKYLLAEYLIINLGFNRLQWKTDALNEQSKNAMLKLGLVYEGTLRRHMIAQSGRVRDSLVFALTDLDWPNVKLLMQQRIHEKSQKLVK